MEEKANDINQGNIEYKININFSNDKIINNSRITINKKYIKCFFLNENDIKSEKNGLNISPRKEMNVNTIKKIYQNKKSPKTTFEPKNKAKKKVNRTTIPKPKEEKLTNPSKKIDYNTETYQIKNKVIKNVLSRKISKLNNNYSYKKVINNPSSEKNDIILDNKIPKTTRNKAMISNNSEKIKFKTVENKLNTEKIKKNKKFINKNNILNMVNNDKNIKKDNQNFPNQLTTHYSKNYFINNWNLLLDNISSNPQTPNSKKDYNVSHRKSIKQKKNLTPNIKRNMKLIREKNTKREFVNNENKDKNAKNNNKNNNKNDITNNKNNITNNKSSVFGIESENNERINGVKINNFNINKPKEENLKFVVTKRQKEKDSVKSFSGASKIIIGKIDAYKDIIETDQKNDYNYNMDEINDSFTFNENEFKIKYNYDYNNDSNYLNSYKKTANNKSFGSISLTINTENNIKDFAQKVNYNIRKQSELEKDEDIKTETNKDNCIII